jgi:hypothetical protein
MLGWFLIKIFLLQKINLFESNATNKVTKCPASILKMVAVVVFE